MSPKRRFRSRVEEGDILWQLKQRGEAALQDLRDITERAREHVRILRCGNVIKPLVFPDPR